MKFSNSLRTLMVSEGVFCSTKWYRLHSIGWSTFWSSWPRGAYHHHQTCWSRWGGVAISFIIRNNTAVASLLVPNNSTNMMMDYRLTCTRGSFCFSSMTYTACEHDYLDEVSHDSLDVVRYKEWREFIIRWVAGFAQTRLERRDRLLQQQVDEDVLDVEETLQGLLSLLQVSSLRMMKIQLHTKSRMDSRGSKQYNGSSLILMVRAEIRSAVVPEFSNYWNHF